MSDDNEYEPLKYIRLANDLYESWAKKPDIRPALARLLTAKEDRVRLALATNPNVPKDVLSQLSNDGNLFVKRAVARNSSTPEDIRTQLFEDPAISARSIDNFIVVDIEFPDKISPEARKAVLARTVENIQTAYGLLGGKDLRLAAIGQLVPSYKLKRWAREWASIIEERVNSK